ncbi:MAG: hypothetical protein ACTHNW_19580 [Mucilaginibacter sp.]
MALLTLIKGVYEYGRQVSDKRAAQFLELRKIYRENQKFQNILEHLYGDQDFSTIPESDRFEFLGFFEDIGFLLNSKKIRKEVVFYMFGYDIIHAWQSDQLWNDESRNTIYWSLLADLAQQMIAIEKRDLSITGSISGFKLYHEAYIFRSQSFFWEAARFAVAALSAVAFCERLPLLSLLR